MSIITDRRNRKKAPKRAISKRLGPFIDLVELRQRVRGIRGMDDLIQATKLSNRLMGKRMGEYRPDKDFYAASTISHWRHPRARWAMKMQAEHLEQAGHVADDWVRDESGRGDVRFQMTVNSPWKCWLEIKFNCGHWERLDMRRRDNERCRECRDQPEK